MQKTKNPNIDICTRFLGNTRYSERIKGMEIVNNINRCKGIPAIKYHGQDTVQDSDICPFCGRQLYLIKKTNVMVCNNPNCMNTVYELVR